MEVRSLYVRGAHESNEEDDDVWDDTILNTAYDRALKLANEEVAKRIAMETNTKGKEKDKLNSDKAKTKANEKEMEAPKKSKRPHKTVAWKVGMPCRAVYDIDGLEYEAFLVKFINCDDCIVKFLGYENTEQVPISSLKPTLGDEERMRQVVEATCEVEDDEFETQTASENNDVSTEGDASSIPAEKAANKKKKKNKKKTNRNSAGSDFGDLPPLPMPTMDMFRSMGRVDPSMPMPPPPPLLSLTGSTDAEEQAISDMLLSWYMTGYYTGLHQGLKRQRASHRYN